MPSALRLHLSATFFRLTPALLCAAILFPAQARAAVGGGASNTTTFTLSTTSSQSVIFSGDGMQRFLTRLQALGTRPPGFDDSFDQAFGDPAVQAAIKAARKILTDAGVPKSVAHQGPVRVASSLTSSGPAGAVTGSQTADVAATDFVFGPNLIFVGTNKTVPFNVAAGTTNFNTNTDTHTDIFQNRGGSLLSETYVFPIDFGAVLSLVGSGLPVALVQREALLAVERVATRDLDGRLFRLRAESGAETGDAGGVAALGTGGGAFLDSATAGWKRPRAAC